MRNRICTVLLSDIGTIAINGIFFGRFFFAILCVYCYNDFSTLSVANLNLGLAPYKSVRPDCLHVIMRDWHVAYLGCNVILP